MAKVTEGGVFRFNVVARNVAQRIVPAPAGLTVASNSGTAAVSEGGAGQVEKATGPFTVTATAGTLTASLAVEYVADEVAASIAIEEAV